MAELEFSCPLPNGLHARPASTLAEAVARCGAEVELVHERSGTSANARSVLEVVALGVKHGDRCRLKVAGADAARATARLQSFVREELPICDEALPEAPQTKGCELPRALRSSGARWHSGSVVCPGIGRGRVVLIGAVEIPPELLAAGAQGAEAEREKLRRAQAAVRAALESRLALRPPAVEQGILQAHLAILGDVGLTQRISAGISAGESAARAISEASAFFAGRMRAAESTYVRERAIDIEDIAFQLLENLHGTRLRAPQVELSEPSVVVAESLTPRQFLALEKRLLQALVLEHTSGTSHAVILARSFGVPTLTGVAEVRAHLAPGTQAVVDANLGIVIPEPGDEVQRFYEREQLLLARRETRLAGSKRAGACTRDGQALEVAANVATVE